MPWDLRRNSLGDLDFSPSFDIAITGGVELIQQRIILRLQMMRGWIYDETGELGSRLFTALAETSAQAIQSIPALVLEALAPMENEIVVDDVIVQEKATDSRALEVIVDYRLTTGFSTQAPLRVVFPLS